MNWEKSGRKLVFEPPLLSVALNCQLLPILESSCCFLAFWLRTLLARQPCQGILQRTRVATTDTQSVSEIMLVLPLRVAGLTQVQIPIIDLLLEVLKWLKLVDQNQWLLLTVRSTLPKCSGPLSSSSQYSTSWATHTWIFLDYSIDAKGWLGSLLPIALLCLLCQLVMLDSAH